MTRRKQRRAKRRSSTAPKNRQKLLKDEAPVAVRAALKTLGLEGKSVRRDKSRIDVFTKAGLPLGHFEWTPRNGYQLFIATPVLRTQSDIGVALEDLQGLEHAHQAVQDAWDFYARTHSQKAWEAYTGALAAFYMRSFGIPTPHGLSLGNATSTTVQARQILSHERLSDAAFLQRYGEDTRTGVGPSA